MEEFVKIKEINGRRAVVEFDQYADMDKIKRYSVGDVLHWLEITDGRKRSGEQVAKAHALIGDIAKSWEVPKPAAEKQLKNMYYADPDQAVEPFSMADCSMSTATAWIEWLLNLCFDENIDFATKSWDILSSSYSFQMQCLKHRECVICRKHAQYCHVETVGMGNSRKMIDHSKHHLMSLCFIHHRMQHDEGIESFMAENHIKPITLTREQCVELGIMTHKRFTYFQERDEYLKQIGAFNDET